MARKAKPFEHQGHFYTTRGGVWKKLCPVTAGIEEAARILAAIASESASRRAGGALGPDESTPGPGADRGTRANVEGRFSAGTLPGAVNRYLDHCRAYYRLPDGRTSSEPRSIALALGYFVRACDGVPVDRISRVQLAAARDAMRATCNRKTINQHVGRIKRAVRWLAEHGELPDAVAASVAIMSPLPAYRSGVRESAPVTAAQIRDVQTVVERLPEPWASVARFQWFTGVRPGEACGLRVAQVEIDPTGDAGRLNFGLNHKTGYRGAVKCVQIGAQAVAVLRPWLYSAALTGREHVFRCTWRERERPPAPSSYAHAVARACRAAGVEWHPNQLRHAYASRVRERLGLEAAQNALGHARADVTQAYAERVAGLAEKAARLLG